MSFWTTYLLPLLASVNLVAATNVIATFRESKIIPDLINAQDIQYLKVIFGYYKVNLGNELTPTEVMNMPYVTWECDSDSYYTLSFADPDVPSTTNHSLAEFVHWLVGNIPCNNISNGDTLVEFVGSAPPLGTGRHRYIFFLFEQPGMLTFDEPRLGVNGTAMSRTGFSFRGFAEKYYLGPPKAGNFYYCKYDKTVNGTLAWLGFQ